MRLLFVVCSLAALVASEELIWEDNFDWLDEGKWNHMISGFRGFNDEFQYYRKDWRNSYTENGNLIIRPTLVREELSDHDIRHGSISYPGCWLEPCVSQARNDETVTPIFSARLHTLGTFTVQYGRIEVRAKMPSGDWLWPAIWMYPNTESYGGWPRSGEIDIAETRGNRDIRSDTGQQIGSNLVVSTLHWGPDRDHNSYWRTHYEKNLENGQLTMDDFHIYEVEWTPDYIKFRFDRQEIGAVYPPPGGFMELGQFQGDNPWYWGSKMAPFDQPFYIILNVAVGGIFFNGQTYNANYERPWDLYNGHPMRDFYENERLWGPTWTRPTMEVDYVRVYRL